MKNGAFFPRGPPGEKLVIFAKMTKILLNIKIRGDSLFYKKCAKFPKKLFDQKQSIFTLDTQTIYTPAFLPVTPVT